HRRGAARASSLRGAAPREPRQRPARTALPLDALLQLGDALTAERPLLRLPQLLGRTKERAHLARLAARQLVRRPHGHARLGELLHLGGGVGTAGFGKPAGELVPRLRELLERQCVEPVALFLAVRDDAQVLRLRQPSTPRSAGPSTSSSGRVVSPCGRVRPARPSRGSTDRVSVGSLCEGDARRLPGCSRATPRAGQAGSPPRLPERGGPLSPPASPG